MYLSGSAYLRLTQRRRSDNHDGNWIPLRAGIDVERAVDIFSGEAYGPDLSYLKGLPQDSTSASIATSMSALCRQVICTDPKDGQHMLHTLAPALLELGEQFTEPARMAHEWSRVF